MGTNEQTTSGQSELFRGYWWRILRPMFWWFLLVLVLFGIHEHQIWIERTRIYFSVTMYETNILYDAIVTLDGHQIGNRDKISLGSHHLAISQPKSESFTTNFTAWYGPHDFGKFNLKRAMGALNVSSVPAARLITITGAECSMTLYDSSGTNVRVPTDQYRIDAEYPHWSQRQNLTVFANVPANCELAPQFGALHLTCNHDGATYILQSSDGQRVDSGNLPATSTEFPVGKYQVTVHYHQKEMQKSVDVEANVTNDVWIEFNLGAVRLESIPDGASVYAPNGNYLGQTPLDLPDVTPQSAQMKLSLQNYEPVTLAVDIVADKTVTIRTNLMSIRYGEALREARQYESAGNYKGALNAVGEVLSLKPDDPEALALQLKVNEQMNAAQKQAEAEQQKEKEQRQQTEAAANAEKERQTRLNRPHDFFAKLMSETPNSTYGVEQDLKASGDARVLRSKLADTLSKSLLLKFAIEQNDEPFPGGFYICAKQTMIEGYRRCYIVGGQTSDGEVTIMFKVMEYTWPPDLALSALLNRPGDDKAIPLDQSNMSPSIREDRRALGVKIVTQRIQLALKSISN